MREREWGYGGTQLCERVMMDVRVVHLYGSDLRPQRVLDRVRMRQVGLEVSILLFEHLERLVLLTPHGDAHRVAALHQIAHLRLLQLEHRRARPRPLLEL